MEPQEIEIQNDDAQSTLMAKVLMGTVAAMALIVMVTVLTFSIGGTFVA